MSKYIADGDALSYVAQAIRTKGGTFSGLEFPDGFVQAIQNISTASGTIQITSNGVKDVRNYASANVQVPNPSTGTLNITANGTYNVTNYASASVNVGSVEKDVNFRDYDGTIVYSYTAQEAQALNNLPANPTHEGLASQGWNYTLADMKAEVTARGHCEVGQMYRTSDNKTHFYITIAEDGDEFQIRYTRVSSTVQGSIDWGDGTTTTLASSTDIYTHVYQSAGDYVVKLESVGSTIRIGASANTSEYTFYPNDNDHYYCRMQLRKVAFGTYVIIGKRAFMGCSALKEVVMPTRGGSTTDYGSELFQNTGLKWVNIPSGITKISDNTFYGCSSLLGVSLPKSITSIAENAFYNCGNVNSEKTMVSGITILNASAFSRTGYVDLLNIPQGVTYIVQAAFAQVNPSRIALPSGLIDINEECFSSCYSLRKLTIPSTVASMRSGSFSYCYSLREIHMLPSTPPTIETSTFRNISSSCTIYVPYSADHSILNAYQTANIWSLYASQMVEESA